MLYIWVCFDDVDFRLNACLLSTCGVLLKSLLHPENSRFSWSEDWKQAMECRG